MTAVSEPYREPKPPCSVCEEREAASKEMAPFVKTIDRSCPECKAVGPDMWNIVCRGDRRFILDKGFWLFKWWRRTFFRCSLVNPPRHFHFGCPHCNHRWTMLTASERS